MKTISKIAAIALVAAFVVGASVSPVKAATVAELQAMIASLSAQIAALSGTTTTTPASVTFTSNLTVGSKGAEVTALQNFLIGKGYNTLATGYFGPMTKAALAAYQTAKGITPAAGYFGPLTRTSVNGEATPVVTPGTTPTTGTGITTPGVEGTVSLTSSSAGTASSIYEGDTQAKIMGLKLEAKTSDISVQRIKLDLGSASSIYNKVLSKIYVMDGSTVLASADLNSSTVVKEGGVYYITLTGFNALVKKDTSKVLTIAVDVRPSVDSTERSTSRTIQTVAQSVRGVDGAGLDQYTVNTAGTVTKTFTIAQTLTNSAALKFSLSSASPKATTVVASAGSDKNESDKVAGLIFNVKAEKDNVLINDLTVSATGTAVSGSEIPTVYLYDGSTELSNASVNTTTGLATFSNLDLSVSKDSTKSLTVKYDVRNATSTAKTLTVSVLSVTTSNVDAENSVGDSLGNSYLSGSATGEQMSVQTAGAVYTLVGTPTLTGRSNGNTASSTYTASFAFDLGSQGSDLTIAATGAVVIGIYKGDSFVASSTGTYSKPTSGVTGSGPYTIADGANARFNVDFGFVAPNGAYTAGDTVHARVMSVTTSLGTVTYISDTFRTNSQTL
jgi:hypothetical protein